MLTDEALLEIQAREEVATPGPWATGDASNGQAEVIFCVRTGNLGRVSLAALTRDNAPAGQNRADAEFIAHAREDVGALPVHIADQTDIIAKYERDIRLLQGGINSDRERFEAIEVENAKLRRIVDALAHEDRYQQQTGEGSTAFIARLIAEARAALGE